MADPNYSEGFLYALWRLKERDDPGPLRKQLEQMQTTRTGRQLVEAQRLLADHEAQKARA